MCTWILTPFDACPNALLAHIYVCDLAFCTTRPRRFWITFLSCEHTSWRSRARNTRDTDSECNGWYLRRVNCVRCNITRIIIACDNAPFCGNWHSLFFPSQIPTSSTSSLSSSTSTVASFLYFFLDVATSVWCFPLLFCWLNYLQMGNSLKKF